MVVYGVEGSHHWLLRCEHQVGPDPICTPSVATHSHLPCPLPHSAALLAVRQLRRTAPSVLPARPLSSFITWSGAEDPQRRREGLAWLRINSAWGRKCPTVSCSVVFRVPKDRKETQEKPDQQGPKGKQERWACQASPVGGWVSPCYLSCEGSQGKCGPHGGCQGLGLCGPGLAQSQPQPTGPL